MKKHLTILAALTLAVSILSFLGSQTFADSVTLNPRPRMQSMGGSGVASKGDQDSAMMNPAGLADVEKNKIQALPILIEVPFDVGVVSSFQDFDSVRESGTTAEKKAALESFLTDVASSAEATRVNLYPSYTRKYMHVGLLIDILTDAKFRLGGLAANESFELGGSNVTAGLILGGAYPFFENRLQVGLTLKPIYRMAISTEQEQRVHDILKGLNANADVADELFGATKLDQKAFGVGADLGLKYWIPYMEESLSPSVGMTYQDIGNTRFFTDKALPANIPQSLSLGVAVHPTLWKFKNTFTLDARTLNEQQEFLNYLHLGAESVIWDMLAIRAGIAQGYFTGGIGFMSRFFEADVYVAAREAGKKANIQSVRTLGLRLALGF